MAKHRTHSIEFKRQVVQEFLGLGGESLHALARRHGIGRNLIKIWVAKFEAGGLDSDAAAADVLAETPSDVYFGSAQLQRSESWNESYKIQTSDHWLITLASGGRFI